MFNQKTSDQERQKKLEMLFKRPNQQALEGDKDQRADKQEEELPVLNDQELNQILARGEDELRMFEEMDQERYLREKKDERMREIQEKLAAGKLCTNYRLMQEWEVPDWVKVQKESKASIFDEDMKLGQKRKTREVEANYSEELTENAWARIVDSGKDIKEEVQKMRLKKQQRDQLKRQRVDGLADSEVREHEQLGESLLSDSVKAAEEQLVHTPEDEEMGP